jgi:DNA-binding transcriptional regulator YiaG
MSAYEALKSEIRRLARKEAKALIEGSTKSSRASRKQLGDLKQEVAGLKREVAELKRAVAGLGKKAAGNGAGQITAERITTKGIVSLRSRLGVSQGEFGRLCGVGGGAVSHWEAGRAHPKGDALIAVLALRGLGKKDVAKQIEAINKKS